MAQQDIERFERIIAPHLDDAYTLARYLLRDEHDAQDVVQEASLKALRFFDRYAGGDSRAWVLSIVRNCARDWHRQHRHERRFSDGHDALHTLAAPHAQTDRVAIDNSERARIAMALDSLPDEFREVIVLREIQQLSYKEVGDVVGVPMGTVMSRLARARKRLAAALDERTSEAG